MKVLGASGGNYTICPMDFGSLLYHAIKIRLLKDFRSLFAVASLQASAGFLAVGLDLRLGRVIAVSADVFCNACILQRKDPVNGAIKEVPVV